jgi:hypothetical protein
MVRIKMSDEVSEKAEEPLTPAGKTPGDEEQRRRRGRGRPKGSVNRKTLEKRAADKGLTFDISMVR